MDHPPHHVNNCFCFCSTDYTTTVGLSGADAEAGPETVTGTETDAEVEIASLDSSTAVETCVSGVLWPKDFSCVGTADGFLCDC